MNQKRQQALYDQWMPLVIHIIDKNFIWATTDTGTGAFAKIRRAVDRDDLKQVGVMALFAAGDYYDPRHPSRSSFKTYAYRIIYNALLNHLDDNCTPVSMPQRRCILKHGSESIKQRLQAATNYCTFSELATQGKKGLIEFDPCSASANADDTDPAVIMEREVFHRHCIKKLKDSLSAHEYRVLLLRFSNMTYRQIGEEVGLSYESVRHRLSKLDVKVRQILEEEVDDFGCSNRSTKSLTQLGRM